MVTVKQTWIGLVVLFLVVLLVIAATLYWQHVTGMNVLHLLADGPDGQVGHGC